MSTQRLTLYRWRRDRIGLAACLRDCFSGQRLMGWCQTPRHLFLLGWDGAAVLDWTGKALEGPDPLGQVYEARFFHSGGDPDGELRWLRDPETDGFGRAAWVSETDRWAPRGFETADVLSDLEPLDALATPGGTIPNRILIQARAELPGIPPGEPAVYRIREYMGPAPEPAGDHGNWIVVEQRILGIRPLNGGGANE